MDDKIKNKALITTVAVCWAFMLSWWFGSDSWLLALFVSVILSAIVGAICWFAIDFVT